MSHAVHCNLNLNQKPGNCSPVYEEELEALVMVPADNRQVPCCCYKVPQPGARCPVPLPDTAAVLKTTPS